VRSVRDAAPPVSFLGTQEVRVAVPVGPLPLAAAVSRPAEACLDLRSRTAKGEAPACTAAAVRIVGTVITECPVEFALVYGDSEATPCTSNITRSDFGGIARILFRPP